MHADAFRDILQRDAVKSVLREKIFRRIENLLDRIGSLLGFGDAFTRSFDALGFFRAFAPGFFA